MLRMTCTTCGKCCKTLVIPATGYDEETIAMKKGYAGKVKFRGESYHVFDIPCLYLGDDNKCKIYADRPEMCKIFPGHGYQNFWRMINPDCGMLDDG